MATKGVKKAAAIDAQIDAFIESEIEKCRITIFSKTTCRFSAISKKLLESLNLDYNAVELDNLAETRDIVQERLLLRTGQATVPNIFINGQHLGGSEDLMQLYNCEILFETVEGKLAVGEKFDFDVVVIGGGSAGLSAAIGCAKNNELVCLIDFVNPTPNGVSWGLGGTCTNVGCIPKKLLHRAAVLGSDLRDAPLYGWAIPEEEVEHDWVKLVNTVQDYLGQLNWKIKKDLIAHGITYLNGFASLNDNHSISVKFSDESERTVKTKIIILAVGGRPRYLEFPGVDHCITSDDIFSLKEFPGRTLIIGGSYVALEVASFLNSLKADVTVMVRSEILNSIFFDRDMADALEQELSREGVKFMHSCVVIKVDRSDNLYQVDCMVDEATPYSDQFNTVILAVGRIPSTQSLKLENVGIQLCSNCKIPVNEKEQTLIKNIFAIGDCANGRPELSSAAAIAGKLLAKRLNTKDCNCTVDYRCVPTSIFTWPEYACCGASETTAIQLNGENHVKCYMSVETPLEQAVTVPAVKCTAKLVTTYDHNNIERLAGFHIVGPNASELIQGFALALRLGATKKDLDNFIGIHPTCAEIFINLKPKGESDTHGC